MVFINQIENEFDFLKKKILDEVKKGEYFYYGELYELREQFTHKHIYKVKYSSSVHPIFLEKINYTIDSFRNKYKSRKNTKKIYITDGEIFSTEELENELIELLKENNLEELILDNEKYIWINYFPINLKNINLYFSSLFQKYYGVEFLIDEREENKYLKNKELILFLKEKFYNLIDLEKLLDFVNFKYIISDFEINFKNKEKIYKEFQSINLKIYEINSQKRGE